MFKVIIIKQIIDMKDYPRRRWIYAQRETKFHVDKISILKVEFRLQRSYRVCSVIHIETYKVANIYVL